VALGEDRAVGDLQHMGGFGEREGGFLSHGVGSVSGYMLGPVNAVDAW
jgi:hypothetical protein